MIYTARCVTRSKRVSCVNVSALSCLFVTNYLLNITTRPSLFLLSFSLSVYLRSAVGSSIGPVRVQLNGVSRSATAGMVESALDSAGFKMLSGSCQRLLPNMPNGVKHRDYDASKHGETRVYVAYDYEVVDRYDSI